MPNELVQFLRQSIIRLCRGSMEFSAPYEIDGIICISTLDEKEQIVVKLHDKISIHHAGGVEFVDNVNGDTQLDMSGGGNGNPVNVVPVVRQQMVKTLSNRKRKKTTGKTRDSETPVVDSSTSLLTMNEYMSANSKEEMTHYSLTSPDFSSSNYETNMQDEMAGIQILKSEVDIRENSEFADMMAGDRCYYVSSSEGSNKSICTLCSTSPAIDHNELVKHLRSVHNMTDVYAVCVQCLCAFPTKQMLQAHVCAYNDQSQSAANSPYVNNSLEFNNSGLALHEMFCRNCQKRFDVFDEFETHMFCVHGRFTCNLCYSTFTERHTLTRHFRIHTKERPFSCDVCGKTFTRKDHVYAHKRNCHPEADMLANRQMTDTSEDHLVDHSWPGKRNTSAAKWDDGLLFAEDSLHNNSHSQNDTDDRGEGASQTDMSTLHRVKIEKEADSDEVTVVVLDEDSSGV